jgi:hypothetical protein
MKDIVRSYALTQEVDGYPSVAAKKRSIASGQ